MCRMKNKFFQELYLDRKQKLKLVELLLIVGSLMTAFQLPTDLRWMFPIFALFSILYHISIESKKEQVLSMSAVMISISFTGIITYNLGIGIWALTPQIGILYVSTALVIMAYYLFFAYLIYTALAKNK